MPDVYRGKLPWTPYSDDELRPLGRDIEWDERSKAYTHKASGRTIVSIMWQRIIAILNQLNVGACTGNAATGAAGTDPVEPDLPASVPVAGLNEAFALGVYSDAETIDGDGPYPPNDNGSSGLSVAKVLKNRGIISGYKHALSLADAVDSLLDGPGLWGTNWLTEMDAVDPSSGLIKYAGTSRGGHELLVRGIILKGDKLPNGEIADDDYIFGDNSWGKSWGYKGSFIMTLTDFGKSLADKGDYTILVPASQPAPTPTPTPAPTPSPTPDAPFPGATPAAAAEVAKLAGEHGMSETDYLNWKFTPKGK